MAQADFQGKAKLFQNGRSQAVRLPAECRFDGDEVYIRRVGDEVILSPRPSSWDDFFNSSSRTTPDFMREREDLPVQDRESLR